MKYQTIKNYVSEHLSGDALKAAAVTGIAAIVLATSGCARTSGGKLTLGQLEWGDKVAMTRDVEVQKKVIEADAKYEDSVNATPGKGFGFNYSK